MVHVLPLLGFNVGRSAGGRSTVREINREACHFPGFPVLQTLLPKHTNVPELYFLLMALFLQQPVTELPDSLHIHVSISFHSFFTSSVIYISIILSICCLYCFFFFAFVLLVRPGLNLDVHLWNASL